MKNPQKLILVRHGESLRNKIKSYGTFFRDEEHRDEIGAVPDHDVTLSEEGVRQAMRVGHVLKERFGNVDCIVHSGYRRTIETMEHALEAYGDQKEDMRIVSDLLISERDPGYGYDMTVDEAKKYLSHRKRHFDVFGKFMSRPHGGESLFDVYHRLRTFMIDARQKYDNQTIVLFTHGGTMQAFRMILDDLSIEEADAQQNPHNCDVLVYEKNDKGELIFTEHISEV